MAEIEKCKLLDSIQKDYKHITTFSVTAEVYFLKEYVCNVHFKKQLLNFCI